MKKVKVGPSFSDYVSQESKSFFSISRHGYDKISSSFRGYFFIVFIVVSSLLLFSRLFYLQIIQGQYFRNLSDNNRIRTTIIHAPRGIIFDRSGKPLVYNTPGFREELNGKVTLLSTQEGISLLSQGKNLSIDSLREYPYADAFAHIIGYVGQISSDSLKLPEFSGYTPQDVVGKMGIERQYESTLKGLDGETLTEVDATGKTLRTLGQTDPTPGQNITLTLDTRLQLATYNAMKDVAKGAAIVTSPTGEVLAMVSKPSFDPNLFTMGKDYTASSTSSYKSIEQILTDGQGQPLLNRAISGEYAPGSTFKIITSAAALETHTIDANFTVEDSGILKVGDFSFANWYYTGYGRTDGEVNVVKAIQRSNDIFYYKVGEMVGVDKLSMEAYKFGLGSALGIDLPGEASGLVPTKEWKQKTIGEQWYLGDDYHYGIGQGYLLTTPLQVNTWTQAVANGGTEYVPHLLKDVKPIVKATDLLTPNNFDLIRQGMIEACAPGGVGWPLFNFTVKNKNLPVDGKDFLSLGASGSADMRQITVACKTGTAQTGGDTTNSHAWITLFAPAYHPQVVVTVLVENGGEGSTIAGPIAKDILTSYFTHQ